MYRPISPAFSSENVHSRQKCGRFPGLLAFQSAMKQIINPDPVPEDRINSGIKSPALPFLFLPSRFAYYFRLLLPQSQKLIDFSNFEAMLKCVCPPILSGYFMSLTNDWYFDYELKPLLANILSSYNTIFPLLFRIFFS